MIKMFVSIPNAVGVDHITARRTVKALI